MADPNYTHIAFILDRSGSMDGIAEDMNGSIRAILREEAERSAAEGKRVLVDVTLFDDEVLHAQQSAPIEKADASIAPRGTTALYDAVGTTLMSLSDRLNAELAEEARPSRVIVIIVTDGMDNASKNWNAILVAAIVQETRQRYGWEFLFLAANIDASAVGQSLGVSDESTFGFRANQEGVRQVGGTIVGTIRGVHLESAVFPLDEPTDPESTPKAPQ